MISAILKAPTYDTSSIAYFKMVDDQGFLCFPDEHQAGLDVLVRVAGIPMGRRTNGLAKEKRERTISTIWNKVQMRTSKDRSRFWR